jgi:hypothetical protein
MSIGRCAASMVEQLLAGNEALLWVALARQEPAQGTVGPGANFAFSRRPHSRFPPVHRADLEGLQRVEGGSVAERWRSPSRPELASARMCYCLGAASEPPPEPYRSAWWGAAGGARAKKSAAPA